MEWTASFASAMDDYWKNLVILISEYYIVIVRSQKGFDAAIAIPNSFSTLLR